MFYFGAVHDKFLSYGADSIKELRGLLNEKKFRVAESPYTSRSVNELDKKGLLKDDRKDKKLWRKFSLKEIIFMAVIKEVRQYGLVDIQLTEISETFFNKSISISTDEAIFHVLQGIQILIVINPTGSVAYYTLPNYDAFEAQSISHVRVNFNEVVMQVWEKLGKKRKEYTTNLSLWASIVNDYDMDEQEKEIMKIIRSKKYKTITVKKHKKVFNIDAEDVNQSNATKKEILDMIDSGDYLGISVEKRDGNVVSVKKSDKFKI
jgi:hypothetical protein